MADPFSSYGAEESPVRLVEQDEQNAVLHGLTAQKALNDIAMQPDRAALLKAQALTQGAHARLYGSMAAEHENNVLRENRFADAILKLPNGLPEDPAEMQDTLARLAAGSGALKLSREHAQGAAMIRQREATAAQRTAQGAKAQLEGDRIRVQSLEGLLRDVETSSNPAEAYRRGNLYYSLIHDGEPSPFAGVPYSPEVLRSLRETVVTRKDVIAQAQKKIEEQGRNIREGIRSRDRALSRDISQAHIDETVRHHEVLEKVGGKATGSPASKEVEATFSLIDEDPEAKQLSAGDKTRLAYDVASRAKEIRTQNRALGAGQALRMALKEARDAGDLVSSGGVDIPDWMPGVGGKRVGGGLSYRGGGKSAKTAITPPLTNGRPDENALIRNRYYETPQGTAQYLGGGQWKMADTNEDSEED